MKQIITLIIIQFLVLNSLIPIPNLFALGISSNIQEIVNTVNMPDEEKKKLEAKKKLEEIKETIYFKKSWTTNKNSILFNFPINNNFLIRAFCDVTFLSV